MRAQIKYFVVGINDLDRFKFVASIHSNKNYLDQSFIADEQPIHRVIELENSQQITELTMIDIPMDKLQSLMNRDAAVKGCILVIGEDNQTILNLQKLMNAYYCWIKNLKQSNNPQINYPKLIIAVPYNHENSFGAYNIKSIESESYSQIREFAIQHQLIIDNRNDRIWSDLSQPKNVNIVRRQLKRVDFSLEVQSLIVSARKQSDDAVIDHSYMLRSINQKPQMTIKKQNCCQYLCQIF